MIPGKQYTPEDVVLIAWRRKWWALIPAALVTVATLVAVRILPNTYESDTLILIVPQRVPESYVRSTVTTSITDRLQSITQQILSRTRLERIIQDFNLYTNERRTAIMEDVVERMRTAIHVEVVKGDAFRVSFTSDDARTSMRVTERLASLFIEENLRDREVLAEGTNQFLEAQLEDARRRLIETEHKVEEFTQLHAAELPEQREANMQGLHNLEMQLQALTEALNRDRDRRLVVTRQIADAQAPDAVPAAPTLPAPPTDKDGIPIGAPAVQQLQAAQEALQQLEVRLTPQHPDVVRLKRTIADLQKKADAEALARPVSAAPVISPAEVLRRNRMTEMNAELEKLDRQIAEKLDAEKSIRTDMATYQKRIEAIPVRDSELTELTRDYKTLQTMYQSLLSKKEDSKIAANLERRQIGEQFKILDPARLPERPTSPNRLRLELLGLGAGLALGIALAALLEYLDKSLRSEADVTAALNLLVIATVPVVPDVLVGRRRGWRMVAISAVGLLVIGAGAAVVAWKVLR